MDHLLLTPGDVRDRLRERVRALRRERGWTQAELAERAALSEPTVRRFERTGQAQLASVIQLASALGRLRDFESLFAQAEPTTLEELRARRRP